MHCTFGTIDLPFNMIPLINDYFLLTNPFTTTSLLHLLVSTICCSFPGRHRTASLMTLPCCTAPGRLDSSPSLSTPRDNSFLDSSCALNYPRILLPLTPLIGPPNPNTPSESYPLRSSSPSARLSCAEPNIYWKTKRGGRQFSKVHVIPIKL